MNFKIVTLFLVFSFSMFSQIIDMKYSEKLNVELLKKSCSVLKIKFETIELLRSSSMQFDEKSTFFAINIKYFDVKENILCFTPLFFLINNKSYKIINIEKNLNEFECCENEAGGYSKPNILKKTISLNQKFKSIGIVFESHYGGCAGGGTNNELLIINPVNKGFNKIINKLPIVISAHEGGCNGNYEREIQESTLEISNKKTNNYFDIKVKTKIEFEKNKEENLDKNEKPFNQIKKKTLVNTVHFDGENYKFKNSELIYFE